MKYDRRWSDSRRAFCENTARLILKIWFGRQLHLIPTQRDTIFTPFTQIKFLCSSGKCFEPAAGNDRSKPNHLDSWSDVWAVWSETAGLDKHEICAVTDPLPVMFSPGVVLPCPEVLPLSFQCFNTGVLVFTLNHAQTTDYSGRHQCWVQIIW